METEINSFDNYIDNGTLYTHFSEFEDKSEIVISSKDKRYALICFEIKKGTLAVYGCKVHHDKCSCRF